jgi:hypothetical protein
VLFRSHMTKRTTNIFLTVRRAKTVVNGRRISMINQICRYGRRALSAVGVIISDGLCHFRPIRVSWGTCRVTVGIFAWFMRFHELHSALNLAVEFERYWVFQLPYLFLLIPVHTVE